MELCKQTCQNNLLPYMYVYISLHGQQCPVLAEKLLKHCSHMQNSRLASWGWVEGMGSHPHGPWRPTAWSGTATNKETDKQRNSLKIMGAVIGEGVRTEGGWGGHGVHIVMAHGGQQRGQGPRPCMTEGTRGV